MSTEVLMSTTDYLDRLDPLRPSLRRLAQIRFDRDEFGEFLEDLKDRPQWRFSPTAVFLASKAHAYLGNANDALSEYQASLALWGEVLEGERPPLRPDWDRVRISNHVLRAQIYLSELDSDGAKRSLALAWDLAAPGGEVAYEDVIVCLEGMNSRVLAAGAAQGNGIGQVRETPIPKVATLV
jgi:hypothetical protein